MVDPYTVELSVRYNALVASGDSVPSGGPVVFAAIGTPRELKTMHAVLATAAPSALRHWPGWPIVTWLFGGGVPRPAKPNWVFVLMYVVPPSRTQPGAPVLRQVSMRKLFAPRSTYSRACVNDAAARIFASVSAFEAVRASPLRRRCASRFCASGIAIAEITPITATTTSSS